MEVRVEEKRFGSRAVLSDVAFTLAPGAFLALVGPSGCGKTTLLRIIAGLDRDFTGAVSPPGRIGVVFQEPRLLPWRTVADNVALPLPGEPGEPQNRARAVAVLESVGLAAEADTFRAPCRWAWPAGWRWPAPSPSVRNCLFSTSRSCRLMNHPPAPCAVLSPAWRKTSPPR
jgi:ABC-type transporter Mla maintaining outer membrane lipid asymmetry ATPase subunit MlaF